MANSLVTAGAATMLGSAVDLSKITVDSYVIAGVADHICPWQSCYRSSHLLGGQTRFILSTSGHIASMVNPPDNAKATFQINEVNPTDAKQWLQSATTIEGSWWPDYVDWLNERTGDAKPAPVSLGGGGLVALESAPGTYVFDL
jgi:polyhydroxyalkanoate synthase